LQVTVQLPDDAVFDHALETPGFTQFQAPLGQTLTWNTASSAPNDVVDAFTFFLAQPSDGAFDIGATWGGGSAGQIETQIQPVVRPATDAEADVALDATTLGHGVTPVGNTGVVIMAESGQIPDGTRLHVRVLGTDSNPSADPGDLWWCSIMEVDGLPANTGVLVGVPVRQPLPPEATIHLFAQQGVQWNELSDGAQVSADGQSVLYVHHGGVVAAGTAPSNQPRLASGLVTTGPIFLASPANRQILGARLLLDIQQQALAQLMVQAAHCPPGNCGGLPPCFSTQLVAGIACANGSIRSQDTSLHGAIGSTQCQKGGGPCAGLVGLLPGGAGAPAGHGTFCSFVGFTQPGPPGLSCSQF
jgi:hypothetical protein